MKRNICKICSHELSDEVYYVDFNDICYSKCSNCNLVYQTRINSLDQNTINSFYDEKYFKTSYKNPSINLKKRNLQYEFDKKIILKYYQDKKDQSILDYGCGNGLFLEKFNSNKFGFEVNTSIIKSKKITYLDAQLSSKNTFDLILMRGVIEHIKDFDTILKKLFLKLKKNGLFFITATPNSSCLSFFLNKEQFNQNCKEHLYHFNHINLPMFFLNNNLYNIDTTFQYFDTPYADLKVDFNHNKVLSNNKSISPPAVGNMMSLVFQKMDE